MSVTETPTTGRTLLLRALLAGSAAMLAPLAAFPAQGQPVVQPIPGEGPPTLSAALLRLGRNPRDTSALIDAGNAALAMGDTDAATGFYTRADRLMPNNAAIQAGLASARVRAEDPFGAIPLFQAAERAGPIPADRLVDRGLAYDLVSDNTAAQNYYRQAIAAGAGEEASRRLAISLAIAGDRRGAEATLAPLLERQDRAAWRVRAFILAILGREEEAVSVVRATMPAELATGVSPYLRYMRQLTPAQQAAAANLGHFPRASEIGHDDPRIAQFAPPRPVRVAVAESAPVEPAKGKQRRDRNRPRDERLTAPARLAALSHVEAPPEPTRISRATDPAMGELPPVQPSQPIATATASRLRPVPAALPSARPTPVTPPAPALAQSQTPARTATPTTFATASEANSFDLARKPAIASQTPPRPAQTASAQPAAAQPAPVPPAPVPPTPPQPAPASTPSPASAATPAAPATVTAPPPAPASTAAPAPAQPKPRPKPQPKPASFSDAFADLANQRTEVAPRAGAVDIRKITPARPAPPPPPPPPPNPSRIWVQVGVGRAESRLEYDWRKFQKDNPELFRARKAWVSEWGRTNRLLVGPFETEKAADAFVAKLRKGGYDDAFTWTSPAGQVVDAL